MKSNFITFYKVTFAFLIVSAFGSLMISCNKTNDSEIKTVQKKYAPQERWATQFEMLKDPATGEIPKGIYARETKAALKADAFKLKPNAFDKSLPSITITSKGPNNYGGRTRALAFDVRDVNVVISGGVSTGIYRSTDNGVNWTKVTPSGMLHNLTCLAQDPRSGHQDTWYAGTGERVGNSASVTGAGYYGYGIWKSTDNGLTWTPLSSTQNGSATVWDDDFDYISRIVVNPSNGHVLAAVSETIKRSTNGGTSWVNELGSDNTGQPGDIIYNASSSKFYAAINGQATSNAGIWSSTDGDTWTQVRTDVQLDANGVKRIVLSNVANTNGILAMYELNNGFTCTGSGSDTTQVGLQQFDGTSTWTDHTYDISVCAAGSTSPKKISLQGGYNMCLTTKPNDANYAYLGGVEIYRYNLSTKVYEFIGGSQAGANAVNLHVDNHILLFESNDIMWSGNDGGLRETDVTGMIKTTSGDDNGYTWTSKNNDYLTYQYYGADINPTNGSAFVAGAAQDNAFTIQPTTAQALEVGPTVDGTSIAIISGTDFNTYSVLASFQNGGFVRLDNGTETDIQPSNKEQGFHSIIFLDADNTNYLYYPYSVDNNSNSNGLVRTRNASGIADGTISSNPASNWEDMTGVKNTITGTITTIEVSRDDNYTGDYSSSDSDRKMYFGTNDSKVYRLNDPAFTAANTNPVDITPGSATGYVSDIAVNPYDDNEILVTYSNYGNVVNVWHTTNANTANPTWTNVEGVSTGAVAIGSVRCAMILDVNNTSIYMVGTSTGLYATDALNGTSTVWTRIGTDADIALSICTEMRLRPSDNKMVLATHGNGLFLLEFPPALPVELVTFEGQTTDEGNLLTWTTAWEENNEGFEIQKSTNGKDFEKIAFVDGKGTTSQFQSYEFLDSEVSNSNNYYRLKQLDYDGNYEYSKVIVLGKSMSNKKQIALYPNPVKDNLTIENGQGNLIIRTVTGQVVLQSIINNDRQQIDVSSLAKGTYIVTIRKTSGDTESRQIVK